MRARERVAADTKVYVSMTNFSVLAQSKSGPARIGIGGPVGSGKTALIERLLPAFAARGINVAVITNDLVTREDAERVKRSGLIDPTKVRAVEAGACPHTVIREDPTLNIAAAEDLEEAFPDLDLIIIESGGDNLASTFSLDLVDWWMFVIDVGQGDDIPRKRGPGIVQSDLLVINKLDLAPYVQVDGPSVVAEARGVRDQRPVIGCACRPHSSAPEDTTDGIEAIVDIIDQEVLFSRATKEKAAAG